MKLQKILLTLSLMLLFVSSAAIVAAGDFDWLKDLNIRAEADPSGFRAQLAARFKIGDTQVGVVLGNVDRPADAYMVLRLGEMSSKPMNYVIEKYKAGKGKGWGALAQNLGIKPGSREFYALKQGNDYYNGKDKNNHKEKSKDNNKGKGRG